MSVRCAEDKAYVGDKAYLRNKTSSFYHTSTCSPRSPHDTFTATGAAAAAYPAFRQLAIEVSALDDATCSIVEELVKAAVKRRSGGDAVSSNQQQPWLRHKQDLQTVKQEEKCIEEDSSRDPQERAHEKRLRQEGELLALWSEGMSQPEGMSKQSGSYHDVHTPPPANNNVGAQENAEAQEKVISATLRSTSHSIVAADFNSREASSAVIGADGDNMVEHNQSTAATVAPASAADESVMEIERLLAALQELLNRLYNVALHAQEILDNLRYQLQPLLAQQAAAALGTVTATAEDAVEFRRVDEEGGAAPETQTAAPTAAPVKVGEANSATLEASGDLGKEDKSENKKREEGRRKGGGIHSGVKKERKDEDEDVLLCDACSTFSAGGQDVPIATDTRENGFYQGHKERRQPESGMCKGGHQLNVRKRQQARHCNQHPAPGKQQQFYHPLQQGSQPQPWFSQAQRDRQRNLLEVSEQGRVPTFTVIPGSATTRKTQLSHEDGQGKQVDYRNRVMVLLQLYEAIVRTIEGEWHFKQEVKEELRFESPFKMFLAVRAAWLAKPFVSHLAPFLREAGSLAEPSLPLRVSYQIFFDCSDIAARKGYFIDFPGNATIFHAAECSCTTGAAATCCRKTTLASNSQFCDGCRRYTNSFRLTLLAQCCWNRLLCAASSPRNIVHSLSQESAALSPTGGRNDLFFTVCGLHAARNVVDFSHYGACAEVVLEASRCFFVDQKSTTSDTFFSVLTLLSSNGTVLGGVREACLVLCLARNFLGVGNGSFNKETMQPLTHTM